MSIILGAMGGLGDAMQTVGGNNQKAWLEQDTQAAKSKLDSALTLDREKTIMALKQAQLNAPLERLGAKAREFAGQEVPQEAAPVRSLTGAGAPAYQDGTQSSGLQGDAAALRAQISKWPEGPDRTNALMQLDNQASADAGINASLVQGKTRKRTSDEALQAAADDAKVNDPVAFADYEARIGKPTRDEKRVNIQEDRQAAITAHYANLDNIRADAEVGKNNRAADANKTRKDIADERWTQSSTLTPEMEITAKAIAEGRLPPLTGYAMRSPGASAIMAKVIEINPNYSGKDYGTGAKAEKDFATGKLGNTARSFNVALAHLDTLSGLTDALNNGDSPLINKIGNAWATQTGGTAPVSFDAAKHIVADEIVKAVTGSAGALGDRESASKTVDAANSPEQLKSVIEVYKHLMSGQLDGLRLQYKATTGKDDFDSKYLAAAAQALGQGTSQSAAPSGGPQIGFVKGGYRFNGGDPAVPSNWSPAQ